VVPWAAGETAVSVSVSPGSGAVLSFARTSRRLALLPAGTEKVSLVATGT